MTEQTTLPGATIGSRVEPVLELRWLYRVAVLVAVSPIWISAIRNGFAHWFPIHDAATTALRARDVFSSHPPLLGLAAQPSAGLDEHFSCFGPLELYLLAIPIRVFGLTWGVLLGMATLNSVFVVASTWLVRRRVGTIGAIVACAFFASLAWSAGSQVIVDLTPVVMGVIPMATLMVATWSAADGDDAGLVVMAAVATYLFQGHMTFVIVVPALVVYGLVGWWLHARRTRRDDPAGWNDRRRPRRYCWSAVAIFTVLAWLPPLVEQVRSSRGNVTKIVSALVQGDISSAQAAHHAPSLQGALGTVVATTAVLPLWLRPTFADPTFDLQGGGTPFVVAALGAAVLVGAYAGLGWWAHRDGDRSMVVGLGTGVVAWFAWLITATRNPGLYGYAARYFHGLWPLSMVVWLLVTLALLRRVASLHRAPWNRRIGVGAFMATLVLVVATIPHANFGSGSPEHVAIQASAVRDIVFRDVPRDGPVLVEGRMVLGRQLLPTALLALQDAGVPFVLSSSYDVQQYGAHRAFRRGDSNATTEIVIDGHPHPPPPGFRQVVRFAPIPNRTAAARFRRSDARIRAWLRSTPIPEVGPDLPIGEQQRATVDQHLAVIAAEAKRDRVDLLNSPDFIELVALFAAAAEKSSFTIPELTHSQLTDWLRWKRWLLDHTVYVDIGPVPRPPPTES